MKPRDDAGKCPSCGSDKIHATHETQSVSVPLGPEVKYEATVNSCADCGVTGDFFNKDELAIRAALEKSRKACVVEIVGELGRMPGLSMAHAERILELSPRTMMRWKNGEFSDAVLSLLRMIKTCPWLLEIADHRYQNEYVLPILAREGGKACDKLGWTYPVVRSFGSQNPLTSESSIQMSTPNSSLAWAVS